VLILIVEDYPDGRDTLAEFLAELGHDVRIAATGEAALAMADERPDVAFIDLLLPDAHGAELAARMRESAPATVLVALTGLVGPEHEARARAAGFRHYLTKPYRIEDVEAIVVDLAGP
jgi:CheY-like chemotaxis protein